MGNLVKVGDEEGLCTISGVAFVLCLSNYPFLKQYRRPEGLDVQGGGGMGYFFFPNL